MEVIEFEKHIQVNDLDGRSLAMCRTCWKELLGKYLGYTVDFCFHNTEVPMAFMDEVGAMKLEACLELRLKSESFTMYGSIEACELNVDSFPFFAELHDALNPDMYWNSSRIAEDPDRWFIRLYGTSYIMMSQRSDRPEIYALACKDADEGSRLLSMAAVHAFSGSCNELLYMVDEGNEKLLSAAKHIGFALCGFYSAYRGVVR